MQGFDQLLRLMAAGWGHPDGCKPPPCADRGWRVVSGAAWAIGGRVRVDCGVLGPSVGSCLLRRETIRLDGRAVPGGRKRRRRHDKGRLPIREVFLVFLPGMR